MYTTCEADKRRSVNHTRSLASPGLAGPGWAEAEAVAVGVGVARRGQTGGAVRVRRDELR